MSHWIFAELLRHARQFFAQADELVAELLMDGAAAAAVDRSPFDLKHCLLQTCLNAPEQVGVVLEHFNPTAHGPEQLQRHHREDDSKGGPEKPNADPNGNVTAVDQPAHHNDEAANLVAHLEL